MAADFQRIRSIFLDATEKPADARATFVADACGDDNELRSRVDDLLRAHQQAGGLLDETELGAAPAASRPLTEAPGSMIGRYKLLQQIGEGGFGVVYMAEQEQPVKRRVALKIIKAGMDTRSVIARFEAERQALAMMDHPNIARVLDAGATDTGRPYFVMELVKGIPITDYCDQANLGMRERLGLFVDVCRAVQHAHQKGIIHRDLKPSNIMVTLRDDKPNVKVIDFGIAKATEQKLTEKTLFTGYGQMIGTPVYMSPEQAVMSEFDVDTRSDIYSLGVLLYELVTGSPPFDAQTLRKAGYDEMRRIIREEPPQRPSMRLSTLAQEARLTVAAHRQASPQALSRQLHGDLDWIVLKAIEKDRARRYESASAFAQYVERHLNSEPVMAGVPGAGYKLKKLIQRNKGSVAAAAAIAVLLLAGTTLSTWQAIRATRAEKQAIDEARRATAAEQLAMTRLAEVAAERDAKEQARKDAEAIAKFLGEVFQGPGPTRDGRTITVAEMLDKAARQLDGDLAAQPAQRAALRCTLGNTYYELGLAHQAIPLQEKVRDYHLATSGPEHPDTLTAMGTLATSYHAAGRRDEAFKLREEVLTLRRKVLGSQHSDTLLAMGRLATSYHAAGRRDEALQLREEVLTIRRQVLGPEHPDTLAAMNNLAISYDLDGRRQEALKLREEVLTLHRKVSGPEHPATLMAMGNLAVSYHVADRRDEALKLREEVLALRRKVLGPEHPETLSAMGSLATSYGAAGRLPEAVALQEQALALTRRLLPPNHPYLAGALKSMTNLYEKTGRKDEAAKLRAERESLKPE